jgi:hypothetical protein
MPQDTPQLPANTSGAPFDFMAYWFHYPAVLMSHLVLAYYRPHASAAFASRPQVSYFDFPISLLVLHRPTMNNEHISVHCILRIPFLAFHSFIHCLLRTSVVSLLLSVTAAILIFLHTTAYSLVNSHSICKYTFA